MDNSSVTVLGFQFEPERDSLHKLFFKGNDENETEHERNSTRVNQVAEECWKCEKCETMLKEKECRCYREVASAYQGRIQGLFGHNGFIGRVTKG